MNTEQAVHEMWDRVTEGGTLDATVREVETSFETFKNRMRARYNIPDKALEALDVARAASVHDVKRRVVGARPWGSR